MAHLFIKYHSGDTGARPIPNCGAQPPWPWLSPSIWMTDANGAPLPKAKVGKACKINVRVDTKEASFPAVSPRVRVQVWACDYTLGVGPQSVRQYTGSFPEAGKTASVLTEITKSAPGTARVDWTPVQGDLRNVDPQTGEAHLCIGANVYWDGSSPPAEPGAMPPPDKLDICVNQHHGQLNIAVQPLGDEEGLLLVDVHNFPDAGEVYRVDVRETPGRLGIVERAQLLAQPFATLVGGRLDWRRLTREVARVRDPDLLQESIAHRALRGGGRLLIARGEVPLRVGRRRLGVLELRADRETGAELPIHVPPGPKPKAVELRAAFARGEPVGAVKAVDLVQRDERGGVIGGGRVLFVKARRR
jgi:hypothetical protein